MVKAAIEHKVSPRRVAHRPQVPHCVASQEWLSEVPYLAGNCEPRAHRMRNRKALTKLSAVSGCLDDFVQHGVGVVVESFNICACQQHQRISWAAVVEFWNTPVIDATEVAHCNRGLCAFAMMHDALNSKENFCRSVRDLIVSTVVD